MADATSDAAHAAAAEPPVRRAPTEIVLATFDDPTTPALRVALDPSFMKRGGQARVIGVRSIDDARPDAVRAARPLPARPLVLRLERQVTSLQDLEDDRASGRLRFLHERVRELGPEADGLVSTHFIGVRSVGEGDEVVVAEVQDFGGDNLREVIRGAGALRGADYSPAQWAAMFALVAQGLAALHDDPDFHAAHRDIKPDNLVLMRLTKEQTHEFGYGARRLARAGLPLMRLTDFGTLRRGQGDDATESLDVTTARFTQLVGTIDYLAPWVVEQAADGSHVPSFGADVWALAFTAFEAMTGTKPMARGKLVDEPDAASRIDAAWRRLSDIEPVLADFLRRCLFGGPDRLPSTDELAAAFADCARSGGAYTATAPGRAQQTTADGGDAHGDERNAHGPDAEHGAGGAAAVGAGAAAAGALALGAAAPGVPLPAPDPAHVTAAPGPISPTSAERAWTPSELDARRDGPLFESFEPSPRPFPPERSDGPQHEGPTSNGDRDRRDDAAAPDASADPAGNPFGGGSRQHEPPRVEPSAQQAPAAEPDRAAEQRSPHEGAPAPEPAAPGWNPFAPQQGAPDRAAQRAPFDQPVPPVRQDLPNAEPPGWAEARPEQPFRSTDAALPQEAYGHPQQSQQQQAFAAPAAAGPQPGYAQPTAQHGGGYDATTANGPSPWADPSTAVFPGQPTEAFADGRQHPFANANTTPFAGPGGSGRPAAASSQEWMPDGRAPGRRSVSRGGKVLIAVGVVAAVVMIAAAVWGISASISSSFGAEPAAPTAPTANPTTASPGASPTASASASALPPGALSIASAVGDPQCDAPSGSAPGSTSGSNDDGKGNDGKGDDQHGNRGSASPGAPDALGTGNGMTGANPDAATTSTVRSTFIDTTPTIDGERFAYGLGCRLTSAKSAASIAFDVPSSATRFAARVGADDASSAATTSLVFDVYDASSGQQLAHTTVKPGKVEDLDVKIKGASRIRLVAVSSGGNGQQVDAIAQWGEARFTPSS